MSSAVYIRAADGLLWHRLAIVGAEHHGTACALGSIPVDEPLLLSADPPLEDRCRACARDALVRTRRDPTVELRPRTRAGERVDVVVKGRTTRDLRARAPAGTAWAADDAASSSVDEWGESGVPEVAMADLVSGMVGR